MKKIVELLINHDLLDDDSMTGVDTVSLVDSPAIGYEWFAFNGLQPYVDQDCEDCELYIDDQMKFESITDYPEYIKEAAAKGIRLNEENGNKCATQTGKVRAQQLAQGKPISEETVRRMYSYLSRAKTYYDASDESACGTISYLLWGGPDALEWSRKKVEQLDKERLADEFIEYFESVGEEYDVESTFIQSQQFADNDVTVGQVTDAIKALGILKGKKDSDQTASIVYRYEGPSDSRTRKLCRSLLALSRTKVFTEDEIRSMASKSSFVASGVIPRAGSSASNYDLFTYASGANCRHRWVEYKMFKSEQSGSTLFIQTGFETTRGKDHGVSEGNMGGYTSQKALDKAKQTAAILYNMKEAHMDFATIDADKRIVVAPAMVPNTLIKRLDSEGREYFVYFGEDTIKDIAEKFFAKNYHNNTDINHDGDVTQANTLLESWIVEDPEKDKSSLYGFNVPKGTWMLSMRINDDETWKKIRQGELRGYSISGNFIEVERK